MVDKKLKLEDIGSEFTMTGLQNLKAGQLLRFDFEGTMIEFLIKSIDVDKHELMAEEIRTYRPDEVHIQDKDGNDMAFSESELE